MKSLFSIFTIFCLLTALTINAQTGISYFISNNSLLPNSKVINIKESDNGNLILVNLCSDVKYQNHSIEYLETSASGQVITQKVLDINNLFDIKSVEKNNSGELTIFGNTSLNKTFEPFQLSLNSSGKKTQNKQLQQIYSTLISDVISYNKNFMILYTKIGKNNLYNISLHKVNSEKGNVEWFKKISSENNEEADKIVVTDKGEFYILGKKYNDDVTEFVPIIYKIDKNGNQLWKKGIDVPSNFNKQSFHILNNNQLIYVCGYTKNPTGFSETRVIILSNTGEEIKSNNIQDFSANGIIKIANGNYLIYGSKFIVDKQQVVTKGKFVIVNPMLENIAIKTLDKNDKPDALLKSKIKTSSDFLCAYNMAGNRIAIGGKVFMPVAGKPNNKFNIPLLMIVNSDGTYKK